MPTAYCCACDWERTVDEDEITELGRAMIDHHVETGHSPIEQRRVGDSADPIETSVPSGAAESPGGADRFGSRGDGGAPERPDRS